MSDILSVLDIINNSVLTTIGYDAMSELSILNLFSYISNKNPENVIRLNTGGFKTNDKNTINTININNIEEIYEEISKLQNKTIIVDNITSLNSYASNIINSNFGAHKHKLIRYEISKINSYCIDNNCRVIIGNHIYQSFNGVGSKSLSGGSSLLYESNTVAFVFDNLLSLEKCRFDDPEHYKDINISKCLIREENLKLLLDV